MTTAHYGGTHCPIGYCTATEICPHTDPQTPATEAGRRMQHVTPPGYDFTADILAIEAEARADALREAADAVRGLSVVRDSDTDSGTVRLASVLAILDPQP